jgi:hypothetical protein
VICRRRRTDRSFPVPFSIHPDVIMIRHILAGWLTVVAVAPSAFAQDPFEIQVYEYATVPAGRWNLETHVNRVGRGEMQGQNHLTFEFTRGITDMFELAGYVVTSSRPGVNGEFAGWRVRPRFRLPEDMLPVKFSLSLEVGFPKEVYEENEVTLEVRPIIEKGWGPWLLDLNPVIGRGLRGPGAAEGWDFEPGVRLGYTLNPRVDLSREYYGATGVVTDPLPASQQVHQFFPGADINLSENVVWNLGVGFGATDAGNTLVYKMRLGWMF